MTAFLLLIGFALHFVSLFAIVLLYLRQNRLTELEKRQESIKREMDEFLSAYLLEFKEENARFLAALKQMEKKEDRAETSPAERFREEVFASNTPAEEGKNAPDSVYPKSVDYKIHAGNFYQAVQAYKQITKEKPDDPSHILQDIALPFVSDEQNDFHLNSLSGQSLRDQAFFLKKQGLTTGEIARKLNKGITEIELLFKFRQN